MSDNTSSSAAGPSVSDFASLYLYGLTNQPYQQSTNYAQFAELYKLVIGRHGGFSLTSSYHPYQLLTPEGVSVWYAAYAQFYSQPNRIELFGEMTLEKTQFALTPPDLFAEYHVWEDTRLTHAENPVFSQYIPFVLPFLVRKDPEALRWDAEVAAAGEDRERLGWYQDAVNEAIKFVQPAPAFVLGFDEFDERRPERLIDNFIRCRDLLR